MAPNVVLVTQSCPVLCDPIDCSPPGSSVHRIRVRPLFTGVGSQFLLEGIFLTQRLYPGFLYCGWILYHLSHQRRTHGSQYTDRETEIQ